MCLFRKTNRSIVSFLRPTIRALIHETEVKSDYAIENDLMFRNHLETYSFGEKHFAHVIGTVR